MSELIKDELNVLKKLLTNIGNDKDIIYRKILENHKDAKEMRKIQAAGFFSVKEIDELANRDVGLRAIGTINQKLREEIEHDIEETSNHPKSPPDKLLFDYLTNLLEDSEK